MSAVVVVVIVVAATVFLFAIVCVMLMNVHARALEYRRGAQAKYSQRIQTLSCIIVTAADAVCLARLVANDPEVGRMYRANAKRLFLSSRSPLCSRSLAREKFKFSSSRMRLAQV